MNIAAPRDRAPLVRRALWLEGMLLGYNALEAVAAVLFGVLAASIALVGFGFDSVIEVSATAVVIWRLRMEQKGLPYENAERRALRFVGVTFFLLAAYVSYESVETLAAAERSGTSVPGMILAGISLILMPVLGIAKLRLARRLESRALRADAIETLVCAYLSLVLLVGLVLNALFGWWWADPAAALCMVPLMVKEGWEGLRGECCACESGEKEEERSEEREKEREKSG